MRKFLLIIALIISGLGLNAQSVGTTTVINYDGYSLRFKITNIDPAECSVYCSTKPTSPKSITIPSSVTISGEKFDVTSIEEHAFYHCYYLYYIEIPNSVTSIKENAFCDCDCLYYIEIPNSVTSIEKDAFYDCDYLHSILIPSSVTSIGSQAFRGCSGLSHAIFTGGAPYAVYGSDSNSPFHGCSSLMKVYVKQEYLSSFNVKGKFYYGTSSSYDYSYYTIGNSYDFVSDGIRYDITSNNSSNGYRVSVAGYEGTSLSVIVPETVNYNDKDYVVGNVMPMAFFEAEDIRVISLPSTITDIGQEAFYGCNSLHTIYCPFDMPNAYYAPKNCKVYVKSSSLSSYTGSHVWNSRNTIIEDKYYDFSVVNDNVEIYYKIISDTEVAVTGSVETSSLSIPAMVVNDNKEYSVTCIYDAAFAGCTDLTTVTLPNSIKNIEPLAFRNCTSLTSIIIPDYVTTIGDRAFENCTSLSSVTLGNTLKGISGSVFKNCTNLATLNWNSVSVDSYPTCESTDEEHPFYGCDNLSTVIFGGAVQTIPHHVMDTKASLTSITIGASVTTIDEYAFRACTGLTEIRFGSSLKTVGDYAFSDCSNVQTLTLNTLLETFGNNSFNNCSSISQGITMPPFVKTIGDKAFFGCSGVTSLSLGINVTYIGSNAFNNCTSLASLEWKSLNVQSNPNGESHAPFIGCTNLTELSFANNVKTIPDYAFVGTNISYTVLPSSLQTIGKYAFKGVANMSQELSIPNAVTCIGEYAFKGCSGLTKVNFGTSLETLGNYSFRECTGLEQDIIIPSSVTTVGEGAFYGCSKITGVAIGSGVKTIGNLAFNNCSSMVSVTWNAENVTSYPTQENMLPFISCNKLNSINIGNAVNTIPAKAFLSCTTITNVSVGNNIQIISDKAFYNCSSLENINIPNSVVEIGESAFTYCVSLTSITLPPATTTIGASAFDGCVSLTYFSVPEGVDTIADYTFQNCSGLSSFLLPSTVTNVGQYAFNNCVSLGTMRCFANEVPVAEETAFANVSTSMNLQVPQASVALYQAVSPWNRFNITGVVTHTVSATATPAAGGVINGIGEYAFGSTATLNAIANPNYSFVKWTENGVEVSTDAHYSFVVTGDRTLVAHFVYGTSYNITATSNPVDGGVVTGTGSYMEGMTATLTATPSDGYTFNNWTENGVIVSSSNIYSFTVNSDRILVANFTEGGGNHWIPDMTIYPNNMSVIAQIQIDGVNQNVTTLEVGAFCGSELRGSQRPQYIQNMDKYLVFLTVYGEANDPITFKLYDHTTESEMNLISPASINFVVQGTIGSVPAPHPLNFISTVTINAVATPSNSGTISGTGTYSIGNNVTLVATPLTGYTFLNWTENGVIVSSEPNYTFVANADRNLVANFDVSNHWIPDQTIYPTSMSLIAQIQIDGVNQNVTSLEIGAFCGGELRGSNRIQYIQQLNKYLVFLTIYGNNNDAITFMLYDHITGQELDYTSPSAISYVQNGTIGSIAMPHVLNFSSAVKIMAAANPSNAGMITGAGDYAIGTTVTLKAIENPGYSFKNWTINGMVVSANPTYSFIATEPATYVANFNYVHSRSLTSGWNWYSTYINNVGSQGLSILEQGLGTNGLEIKDQALFVTYTAGAGWFGSMTQTAVEEMYMIKMSEAAVLNISGSIVNTSEHPITLTTNWRWFSYPLNESMSIASALSNFAPHDGDYIKSQAGFSQYYEGIGWLGAVNTMTPGEGYMYKNTSGIAKVLIYPSSSGSKVGLKQNVTPEDNYWQPDMTKYADNMNIIAVVDSDSDYEIGAFCEGECRGSARPIYIEELDKKMIFLTVYGESQDEIMFRYYDVEKAEEYAFPADEMVVFGINSTLGSIKEPYDLHFGMLGVEDKNTEVFTVYPNPATISEEIYLGGSFEMVEVYNALGVKVAIYEDVDKIESLKTAGVYVIKIINDNEARYCRVIIK